MSWRDIGFESDSMVETPDVRRRGKFIRISVSDVCRGTQIMTPFGLDTVVCVVIKYYDRVKLTRFCGGLCVMLDHPVDIGDDRKTNWVVPRMLNGIHVFELCNVPIYNFIMMKSPIITLNNINCATLLTYDIREIMDHPDISMGVVLFDCIDGACVGKKYSEDTQFDMDSDTPDNVEHAAVQIAEDNELKPTVKKMDITSF